MVKKNVVSAQSICRNNACFVSGSFVKSYSTLLEIGLHCYITNPSNSLQLKPALHPGILPRETKQ
uniref:Uncharacterized protein n=1 Tax=Candidatus Berkiella cookevillensis TaxID=437022 RepID=A0A0Q9YBS8_9GAMM